MEGDHPDCGIEMTPAKRAVKLFGSCKCKEAKEASASSSIAAVIQPDMILSLNEGGRNFCWKDGVLLPGYKTPPMKPPPMV